MVDVEVVEAVGVRSLSRKQTQGMDGMDGMDADSSRRPLPFARLFSLFGHRAALLLMVAPCVSFLIAGVQTIAWSAGTIRARDLILWNEEHANRATAEQMALLEVPAKFVGNLDSCCSRGSSMSSIGPAARTRCSASSACPSLCTDGCATAFCW